MTNETNTSAAARRIAGRISARSKNQEHPQDTTTAAKQQQTSFAHTDIPDSKNRLLGTTARRSTTVPSKGSSEATRLEPLHAAAPRTLLKSELLKLHQ